MFSKLMKNEFRNIGKLLVLINTIVLGMHFLEAVFEKIYASGVLSGTIFEKMFGVFAGIYIVSIFAVNVIIVLIFAERFYKKVYSVEGYLTHTLPVNKSAIYFAMLISSSIGTIITSAISFAYLLIKIANGVIGAVTFEKLLKTADIYNINGLTYFLFIILIVISVVSAYALIFLSVSIGQNWKAHPVLGSILSYWAITTGLQIFGAVALISLASYGIMSEMFSRHMLPGDMFNITSSFGIGVGVVMTAVMSAVSIVIMKKRINL